MRPTAEISEEMLDLAKMLHEPLLPELEKYVVDSTFGKVLKHPLVFQVPGIVPGIANRALRKKQQYLKEAEEAKEWYSCVFLHERPYRTWALIEYVIGTDEYGFPIALEMCEPWQRELAADVWRDSENLEEYSLEWSIMLDGEGLLICDDPEGFEALPETLTIYRGDCPDAGWSWSLDYDTARWFANRVDTGQKPWPLLTATVRKEDVVGYLSQRGESEILVAEDRVQMEDA